MSALALSAPSPRALPKVQVPVWAWAMAALGVVVLHLGLQDNGVLLQSTAELVHELTHDGRHAFGVPCH